MQIPRLVITAPASDQGKTIVATGLMAAFRQRGYQVQGFKAGPDYIDPSYYRLASGRSGRNLDLWMQASPGDTVLRFAKGMRGADAAVIEGVMGYFDGYGPLSNDSSTYHLAQVLRSPALLVIDGRHSARSLAAVVLGFRHFSAPDLLAGVVITKIGTQRHYRLLKTAVESESGLPCFGFIPYSEDLAIPHRQLGILPAEENVGISRTIERLGKEIAHSLDLGRIWEVMSGAPELDIPKPPAIPHISHGHPLIAVAMDEAFNFYYADNLELLEELGAQLVYFSPLAGDIIPQNAQALYLGGGFPEEFAMTLSSQRDLLQTYHNRIRQGLSTLAECGGYMFLANDLINSCGEHFPMVGIVPHTVVMHNRLQAVGYRTATTTSDALFSAGSVFRGHEFHYSRILSEEVVSTAYLLEGKQGKRHQGYQEPNILAGYAHLYLPSNVRAVRHWLDSL